MSHVRKRARKIVDAAKASRPDPMRELIAKSGQPESLLALPEQHGLVLEDRDARAGKRTAYAAQIVPPVVIAEDRPDAERRMEPGKFARPERIVDRLDLVFVPGFEIAEQHDEVGVQRIRRIDDAGDLRQRDMRTAGMQVGDHRDRELAVPQASSAASRRKRVTRRSVGSTAPA